MIIRPILPPDAQAFLELRLKLDQETSFMMFEPGERPVDLRKEQEQIDSVLASPNSMIFIAEHESRLVGFLSANGGQFNRDRKTAYIVIGILREFSGRGIGTRLFEMLEAWAQRCELHRLELTVMTHNSRGIALYQKSGFQIEGTMKEKLLVDGSYVDEHIMAKIL